MSISPITGPDFSTFPVTSSGRRFFANSLFKALCWITTSLTLLMLVVLLGSIVGKAMPVFGSRPDTLQSTCWANIVQGGNPENDPAAVDDGDLLQGLFVAQRLLVGGLSDDADIDYRDTNSMFGVFSFELRQNPLSPAGFECRTAGGDHHIVRMLDSAGIDAGNLRLLASSLDNASIAVCKSENADWELSELDGSNGLFSGGRIANVFEGRAGWELMWAAGNSVAPEFCELTFLEEVIERTVGGEAGQAGEESGEEVAVSIAKIEKLRPRRKLAQLTGLFSVAGHESTSVKFGEVKNRISGSDAIASADIAIRDKDAVFKGSRPADKHGFDFVGTLHLTHDFGPDQGNFIGHIASFVTQLPKSEPNEAAIGPALAGTLWVCIGCALFALPLGIGTAICLEEFKPKNRFLLRLHALVQLNISNLAGVPSIVYGIVGYSVFGAMFGFFGSPNEPDVEFGASHYIQYRTEGGRWMRVPAIRGSADDDSNWVAPKLVTGMNALLGDLQVELNVVQVDGELPDDRDLLGRTLYADAEGGPVSDKPWYYVQLPFGRSVLAASLTLMLVILPVIIIASQEALRSVSNTLRQGALGLGATRWQTVRNVSLPAAIPSIMTGAILAMSRAIGEAAPIIVLAGTVRISSGPRHLMDNYSVLPVQLFYWTGQPIDQLATVNWQNVVSAGILVLLVILFSFNAVAITIRHWTQKPLS